jgi:hypothetical protein
MSLTNKGRTTFERIWPKARENVSRRTNVLSTAETQELKRLLDLLCSADDREEDAIE